MQLHVYMRTAGLRSLRLALAFALLAFGFGFWGSRARIPSRTYGSACGHSSAEGGAVLRCEKWQREWQVASGKWRWRRAESGAVLVCINRLIGADEGFAPAAVLVVSVHGAGCTRHGFVRVLPRK
jgi:hypothetical protein